MKQILDTELDALNICAEALQADGVVALPTETVYGLVTRWDSEAGRERIYHLKHRPSSKRLQMLAPSLEAAWAAGVADLPELRKLAAKFWPGALTVVVPNADRTDTIGLRIPNHPFVLNLLKKCNCVFAATSANLSGTPPATNIVDAVKGLDGEPDVAVDGGVITVTGGQASTVVSLLNDTPVIIREGAIKIGQIAAVLG
ncbi:MAG: L-threonylcarbamoyladenylate synthase [Victivallales bacterium]|nr:L-threonylcarbamoyladenylate synthase [Victivallales bacterium]